MKEMSDLTGVRRRDRWRLRWWNCNPFAHNFGVTLELGDLHPFWYQVLPWHLEFCVYSIAERGGYSMYRIYRPW